MTKPAPGIEADIEGLFKLPLPEFTAARNTLAARLKKQGHPEEADRVKALAKPPISAWSVNQLHWQHGKDLDALLSIGERFRKAQAAQLAGKASDLRGLLNERREALSALAKRATAILGEAGHTPSPDITRRITTTLEALATYGTTEGAPPAGRLTDDIDPPGFEALAALVPRSGDGGTRSEPPRVLQFRREELARRAKDKKSSEGHEARRAKAREAVAAAEKALREAQRTAERAEATLKKAAARAKAAEKDKNEAETRLEKAQAEFLAASKHAHRVAREAEEAAQGVTDAERDIEKAKVALGEID